MKDYREEFLSAVRIVVQRYCKAAQEIVVQRWASLDNIDGNASIRDMELTVAQDVVARAICATGQKAWIAEYGKGSLMETKDNPFLSDYVNSSLFNKDRLGHALATVGRDYGYYEDLDGKRHFSHGGLKGKVIETFYGQPLFFPIRAKHVIKETVKSLEPELYKEIQEAIANVITNAVKEFPKKVIIYAG